jgi:hypothetical protein
VSSRRRSHVVIGLVVVGTLALAVTVVRLSAWISEGDHVGQDRGPRSTTPAPSTAAGVPSVEAPPATAPTPVGDLQRPVRAIFYYPWFPEAWTQRRQDPYAHYTPKLGLYDSSTEQVVRDHVAAMRYAGFDAGISSWWGPGTPTDQRLGLLLDIGAQEGLAWAPYYEAESLGDPSPEKIRDDLAYLQGRYGRSPALARIDGRMIVFVFGTKGDGCNAAERWHQAAGPDVFIVLKVFDGYRDCPAQPDSWHQYAPARPYDQQLPYSVTVSPGFWSASERAPRLSRDLGRWRDDVRRMVASGADFQLVTTFNEWGEGTAVEASPEWASASGNGSFLDVLHDELRR